ncbi:hypothetical protein [Bradyrhizobium sp. CSS354]|uniref:hypothetical protein n=1 Tax=Bradyrhizobium sp. CSS354 TaxID=2699172 RepID=UPI0023AFEE69|nr:hypothetical protein [Bradyrhizobium sp. CSS354]MDE5461345.1 hypothetical protein [Bradyrhizobium sp. CSS354]
MKLSLNRSQVCPFYEDESGGWVVKPETIFLDFTVRFKASDLRLGRLASAPRRLFNPRAKRGYAWTPNNSCTG